MSLDHISATRTRDLADSRVPVMVVFGTRPEAIKMFPLVHRLRESSHFRPVVLTTGQHRDLVGPILDLTGITPDIDLAIGRTGLSVNGVVSAVLDGVSAVLETARAAGELPAAVLVHGDTSSAMAAGLAAFNEGVPVVHVESGLRTNDLRSPFPEEMNRQVLGRLAGLHLAPTRRNAENLVREGISLERVVVTGNTGLDALRWTAERRTPFHDPALAGLDDDRRRVVVVTAHRRENWGAGLEGIVEGVRRVAERHPEALIVWPVHPNPRVKDVVVGALGELPNVVLTTPMDYAEFAHLLDRAHLAVTDSGGIQEEAPGLGTPVLVTRNTTERQEGVDAGGVRLVGTDPDAILAEASALLTDESAHQRMAEVTNPFGDGRAADRIVAALEHVAGQGPAPRTYGPGFNRNAVIAGLPMPTSAAVV